MLLRYVQGKQGFTIGSDILLVDNVPLRVYIKMVGTVLKWQSKYQSNQ